MKIFINILIAVLFMGTAHAWAADIIWYINASGQSVSTGTYSCPELSTVQPYSNLNLDGNGDFIPLVEEYFSLAGYGNCETPDSGLANTLTLLSGRVVAITHHGVPGYAIAQLNQGTTPYNNSLTAVSQAWANAASEGRGIRMVGTLWTQGESDYTMTSDEYEAELIQLQEDYQADIQAITGVTGTLPLITSQCGKWSAGYSGVAVAQFRASVDYPGRVICALPLYLTDHSADWGHLTNTGSRRLGEYYGKVINEMIENGGTWRPLSPISIRRSGTMITIKCHVPVPPIVVDTATLGAVDNYGFTVIKDSDETEVSINSVSVSGSDTIIINLVSDPGEKIRVTYALEGYGVIETHRYSWGNIRDSDTTTGIADDGPLYNWLVLFDESEGYGDGTVIHGSCRMSFR